jgi:nicotinate-nucleotide pyrophosphorylase (carboxylating)
MNGDALHDGHVERLIELAIMEDVGLGDLTSEAIIPDERPGKAELLCKEDGVLAGLAVAAKVFRHCDDRVTLVPSVADGGEVKRGETIALIGGNTRAILMGERTALNFLQRMSGIATLTRKFVKAVAGTGVKITDTRKTVPGLRVFDKWAVRLGGGVNHRFGLDDMILIKDNHIAAAGSITNAVERCRRYMDVRRVSVPIEVETKNLPEVEEALSISGIARIMLDNFAVADMRRAVELIDHRVEVEASGGITLDSVEGIAGTGVDYVSIGGLTHSAKALDISLELVPNV